MLTIITDIKDNNWLVYIIAEFQRINKADFEVEIVGLKTSVSSKNIIHYVNKTEGLHCIYNCECMTPSSDIEYIKDDLYVLKESSNQEFSIEYDLFWNAFVFLSRYEEYLLEQDGKNIYSYSLNHPRNDKASFDIPIVNILFNELEKFIKNNFSDLKFEEKKEPFIDLSHDVDYIKKTIQLRLKQTVFNGFNMFKSIGKPIKFFKNMVKTMEFMVSSPSYWCFDYWEALELKHGRRSTFYVYVKDGNRSFKSWLIDPSYNIKKEIRLQKKLKDLKEKGFEIGLHGSYNSAKSFRSLKNEKEILENILDCQVTKTRQHWLNYDGSITPYSHEKLFKYDSTLGWNDRMGFRSGCASKYRPYDFNNKKAFNYMVIPQVIMDSNIYDYANNNNVFEKAKAMVYYSKKVSKTTYISISWHQRVASSDYKWNEFYEELLNDI